MRIEFNYTAKVLRRIKCISLPIFGNLEKNIIYTFSGKSSISLLLRYYRMKGNLRDRADQILVPQWLGGPVYMIMHRFCFPTTTFNSKTRGLLVYHQWGFPQNMDYIKDFCDSKKLFCIEDCAHSFESYYRGQRLGTIGDAALFSLSKFFPCVVGGAIYTAKDDMKKYIGQLLEENEDKLAKRTFNHCLKVDKFPTKQNILELERNYAIYDKLLKCPDYSLMATRHEIFNGALEKRKENCNLFKKAFGDQEYLSNLLHEVAIPWVVPLFFRESILKRIVAKLKQNNIKSDIYHFDINRNFLKPDFKECVPLPCHQGMKQKDIFKIINIIKKII